MKNLVSFYGEVCQWVPCIDEHGNQDGVSQSEPFTIDADNLLSLAEQLSIIDNFCDAEIWLETKEDRFFLCWIEQEKEQEEIYQELVDAIAHLMANNDTARGCIIKYA